MFGTSGINLLKPFLLLLFFLLLHREKAGKTSGFHREKRDLTDSRSPDTFPVFSLSLVPP